MTATLYARIGELTTNDPTLGDETPMGRVRDAALVVVNGAVAWVGSNNEAPEADTYVDLDGAAVVPGFVDSHTHLVFAGERSDEFEARMAGATYDGGGITRTVTATRAASDERLRRDAAARARAMRDAGTTTLEVKSGYELTLDGEVRLLEIAGVITDETTFLGAHVVPDEFARDRDDYVSLVAGAMMDACAPLARWVDVFCERGAFSVDEARLVLDAGSRHGLGLRVHGNQLGESGGVALAVERGAASVDHCTHVSDGDVAALAGSSTVATLLPGAEFSTRSIYSSARRLLDAGVTVALATDCNPGTSYVTSMPFVIALGVREMGMTCDEALRAATAGGAAALRRTDVGHLGVGARADLVILDAPRAAHLAYRPGDQVVASVRVARAHSS
ncbi:MAG TPA: imidazolonepropionase [Acidimicrobiales bacterium]|nr:imidazolonepropionase [Acidimicrobiales bacterium]